MFRLVPPTLPSDPPSIRSIEILGGTSRQSDVYYLDGRIISDRAPGRGRRALAGVVSSPEGASDEEGNLGRGYVGEDSYGPIGRGDPLLASRPVPGYTFCKPVKVKPDDDADADSPKAGGR